MTSNNISAVPTDDPVQDDINALNNDMIQSVEVQQQAATLYAMLQELIKESYTAQNPNLICMEMNAAMGDYQGSTAAEWGAQNQVQNGLNNLNTDSQTMMNNVSQALENQITPPGSTSTATQIYNDLKTLSASLSAGSGSNNYSTIASQITAIQAMVNSPTSTLTAAQATQITADLTLMAQYAAILPNNASAALYPLNLAMFNIYDTLSNYPAGSSLATVANDLKTIENDMNLNNTVDATQDIQNLNNFLNSNPSGIDPTTLKALQGFAATMASNYTYIPNGGPTWSDTQDEETFFNSIANCYDALTRANSSNITPPDAEQVQWINDMLNALTASDTFIQNNPNLFTNGSGNSIIATNESMLNLFGSSDPDTVWNTVAGWLQSSATQGTTSTEIQTYSSDIQTNGRTLGAQSSASQTQMDLIVNQYKQTEGDLENFVQATLQSTLTQVHNEKNQ